MQISFVHQSLSVRLASALFAFLVPALSAQQQEPFALVIPQRRAVDPVVVSLPELPAAARHVAPLTLKVTIETMRPGSPPQSIRRTISRTAEAIHIVESDGGEWFFERNAVDPRRVAGQFVDHATRTVIYYPETDLRNYLNIRGWMDAFTLGVDLDLLRKLEPAGTTRVADGITFHRYVALGDVPASTEIWWSEEQMLANAVEKKSSSGSTRYALDSLAKGVASELLRKPGDRYPGYRKVDVADWLEER